MIPDEHLREQRDWWFIVAVMEFVLLVAYILFRDVAK